MLRAPVIGTQVVVEHRNDLVARQSAGEVAGMSTTLAVSLRAGHPDPALRSPSGSSVLLVTMHASERRRRSVLPSSAMDDPSELFGRGLLAGLVLSSPAWFLLALLLRLLLQG